MIQNTSKKRYYAHGDLHEEQPNLYYCAKCDAFEPLSHFDDPSHIKNRQERYKKTLSTLKSYKNHFRPPDAQNIITTHAKADKNAQSAFFKWLLRQLNRDDQIGDLAKDVKRDPNFPKTAKTREIIYSYIAHKLGASREALVAFDESWDEFKTNTKIRSGMSLTLRFVVFKRDSYRCQICGATAQDGCKLEVDHKVPVAKGGLDELDNLQTLCFECNRGKGISDIY